MIFLSSFLIITTLLVSTCAALESKDGVDAGASKFSGVNNINTAIGRSNTEKKDEGSDEKKDKNSENWNPNLDSHENSQPASISGHHSNKTMTLSRKDDKTDRLPPCVNSCRYTDPSMEYCWKGLLEYHALELREKVENLYGALLHVDHWKRSKELENDNYTVEKSTLNEVLNSKSGNEEDGRGKLNFTILKEIFGLVFEEYKTQKHNFDYSDEANEEEIPSLPSLSCPIPCDYYPQLWMTLTFVLSVTLVLFISVVLLYFFCDTWSPRHRGNKHRIV